MEKGFQKHQKKGATLTPKSVIWRAKRRLLTVVLRLKCSLPTVIVRKRLHFKQLPGDSSQKQPQNAPSLPNRPTRPIGIP